MKKQDIARQILFLTVRIETVNAAGARGSGTGFFFSTPITKDLHAHYIITNRHVIEGAQKGSLFFFEKEGNQAKLGKMIQHDIDKFESVWIQHPDPSVDLVAMACGSIYSHYESISRGIYYKYLVESNIATSEEIEAMSGIEEVVFIGYPNGIWDSLNGLPVARKGISATPIEYDFEGHKEFVIDASVFGGSSGSPVFTYKHGVFQKHGQLMNGPAIQFVGVVRAVFFRKERNEIVKVPAPTYHADAVDTREMLDLGLVIKASRVLELVRHAESLYSPFRNTGTTISQENPT